MSASPSSEVRWAPVKSGITWFQDNVFTSIGAGQLVVIAGTFLAARLFVKSFHRFLENRIKGVEKLSGELLTRPLSILFGYILWALMLWFCQSLAEKLKLPADIFRLAINLALGLMVIHVALSFAKKTIWTRSILVVGLIVITLRLFDLWHPTIHLFDGMKADLGPVSFTVWGLIRFAFIFALLWSAVVIANRLFGQWLSGSKNLTVSDQILISRVFNTSMFLVIVLFSLNAAGIHLLTATAPVRDDEQIASIPFACL